MKKVTQFYIRTWNWNVQQNGQILHQNKAKIKKKNMPRRIFFQEWFPFRVTEFPVERAFTIGWWCYITPVSSISCPNIELCQLFHWPKNVNKPNLVFLHILECTIRNTFLTNINLGRLSDIASHFTASDSKTTQSVGDNRKIFPLGAALQVPQNFSFAPL
jgi:hypothetical protein